MDKDTCYVRASFFLKSRVANGHIYHNIRILGTPMGTCHQRFCTRYRRLPRYHEPSV